MSVKRKDTCGEEERDMDIPSVLYEWRSGPRFENPVGNPAMPIETGDFAGFQGVHPEESARLCNQPRRRSTRPWAGF